MLEWKIVTKAPNSIENREAAIKISFIIFRIELFFVPKSAFSSDARWANEKRKIKSRKVPPANPGMCEMNRK